MKNNSLKKSIDLEEKANQLLRKADIQNRIPYFQQALNYLRRGEKLSAIPENIMNKLYSDQKEELKKFYLRSMKVEKRSQAFSQITGRLHEVAFIEKKNEEFITKDPIHSEVLNIFRSNNKLKKFCLSH